MHNTNIAKAKIASLVILLVVSFVITTFPTAYAAPHIEITVATAWNMMTDGTYPNLVILDARNQSEYDTGYISRAKLMPLWQLEQRIGELSSYKNNEIIVYCRTGGRSHNASLILDANNFTKVYDMTGGINAWNSSGYPIVNPIPPATGNWTLMTDARSVKGYPELREYVWQKNASMPPNGQYDKIGLHRLVKTGITPKGVIFVNPGTYCSGEQLISNPSSNSYTTTENDSQPYYWANRGFDVYAIDYRTHFVPSSLNMSQLGFMANWGHDQWISDVKESVLKTKEVSGASKVFIAGQSFGARIAIYYATKYWQEDLRGIILLDGGVPKYPKPTNSYNLTAMLNQNNAAATWANIAPSLPGFSVTPTFQSLMQFAMIFPNAPANVPGTNQSLTPPINPLTSRTWTNITEWTAFVMNGPFSNTLGGYGNIAPSIRSMATMDRYWPDRLNLEYSAIRNWTNCPYVTFDFDEYFKDVNVPLIGFTSELYGIPTFGGVVDNIANPDVTKTTLLKYGHGDVFMGTYSARDVSQPVLDWMLNRYQAPAASAFCNVTLIGGGTWYFFAHSNGGFGPHSYQWYEGTTLLQGQTSMVLPVTKNTHGIYTYYCKITDSEGTITNSNTVTLTVLG